jgi:hypothetical protein
MIFFSEILNLLSKVISTIDVPISEVPLYQTYKDQLVALLNVVMLLIFELKLFTLIVVEVTLWRSLPVLSTFECVFKVAQMSQRQLLFARLDLFNVSLLTHKY